MLSTLPAFLQHPIATLDPQQQALAVAHQQQLTKPPGALGALEAWGIWFATVQRTQTPQLNRVRIAIFAADHGVTAEGISAYPQAVTAQMVRNFAAGGAAISVLARLWNLPLSIINVGTVTALEPLPPVQDRRIAAGTANCVQEPAMTAAQCQQALRIGMETVDQDESLDLFIGGEMGIGNTTAASALGAALLPCSPTELVGPGTGLKASGIARKVAVVEAALRRHWPVSPHPPPDPLEVLRCVGGFEIAALVGAYIHCGQRGIPVLVDGFITTAAALVATRLRPEVADWLRYAHQSAEPGHRRLLAALNAKPLIDLGMRLGEGSGAATAFPLVRAACALHGQMATFTSAHVAACTD